MEDLGFRAPDAEEERRILAKLAKPGEPGAEEKPLRDIPAAVVNADPLISFSGIARGAPLGLASVEPARLRHRSAWFLISPTWTMELDGIARKIREKAVLHRRQAPGHRLIFICNTPKEETLLRELGEAAFFYNKTANVPEWIFKPLDGARVEFDAVYNAQLLPFKRHELCLEIERCIFLFYRDAGRPDAAEREAEILKRHAARAPGHVFVNPFDRKHVPIRLSPSKVNQYLNTAAVGLCLSEREGAMFASMEYLLSGLCFVSTPSMGGRDVYYDEDYCRTVPADPRSVAEAVAALKAKNIPRQYVRDRTLRLVERDRARFLGLLNSILEESGSDHRFAMPWPFRKTVIMQWMEADAAVDRAVRGVVDAFEQKDESPGRTVWRRLAKALRRRR
jgi:hypothetical protein